MNIATHSRQDLSVYMAIRHDKALNHLARNAIASSRDLFDAARNLHHTIVGEIGITHTGVGAAYSISSIMFALESIDG